MRYRLTVEEPKVPRSLRHGAMRREGVASLLRPGRDEPKSWLFRGCVHARTRVAADRTNVPSVGQTTSPLLTLVKICYIFVLLDSTVSACFLFPFCFRAPRD